MTTAIQVKRGATLALAGLVQLPAGAWSASSQLRGARGEEIGQLGVTLTQLPVSDTDGNTHAITLGSPASVTSAWPLGTWLADVRFTDGETVNPTDTFTINVVREVTRA